MPKVDPQQLRDHASRLINGPMPIVVQAADAAKQVRLGDENAYGVIFAQLIPPALDLFLDDGTETLDAIDDLGNGFAEALKQTAIKYQTADEEVAAVFDALLKELDK
ncbi:type VII secretion target [Glycomyces harbinensis]|uniref:Excreted virulence factor EspC, type VII ESX diderm n=1 Tax=Glycomyces harbinensis TaxID=58114 RepID=A0A1G7DQI8_9ACTN|nr:type VII secretion target [Glycomyces harbinensis]SDE53729.1 Excreted virulence factor EspC, type VII ESX diderm [Glycomyces harbinensis]